MFFLILTFKSRSTNVQLAWAISAGLTSAVVRFAESRLIALVPELGFWSREISRARHLLPFLTRRRLLPLFGMRMRIRFRI